MWVAFCVYTSVNFFHWCFKKKDPCISFSVLVTAKYLLNLLWFFLFQGKKIVIFGLPGAYTGVCSQKHVPSFYNYADKFKEKGVASIICVAVNDPYVMNAWAEKLQCSDKLDFYGDFDGKFHKHLKLDLDLSSGLLGHRSQRWAAYVENSIIKLLNVEKAPSDFKLSDAKTLYEQMWN